jgi:hypothetical protein
MSTDIILAKTSHSTLINNMSRELVNKKIYNPNYPVHGIFLAESLSPSEVSDVLDDQISHIENEQDKLAFKHSLLQQSQAIYELKWEDQNNLKLKGYCYEPLKYNVAILMSKDV